MTGFGFPGEKLFNWIHDVVKGRYCLQCRRKLDRKKLKPRGTCSWECVDTRECRIFSKSCSICKHYRLEKPAISSPWEVEYCVADGKRDSIFYSERSYCVGKIKFEMKEAEKKREADDDR